MYRYSVDNAVTYTSEDFVLFRESPFACWMERLNLENPDHGIPADIGSLPPGDSIERQDDMADTLCAEGKDVRLIDWDADEASRRSATLAAMRNGADFIVNGQLALGPLSGAVNLLMRTSGYSELGDFLYIPCETQTRTTPHSAFRLCFVADLLHSLQGQLPPQMLIIRGGDDLVPLRTESHIYHYRAVKQRFMESMRGFRKHRMPDPAESSHFGRWSDCAHEVLKQRLLREEQQDQDSAEDRFVEPLRAAASGSAGAYDLDDATPNEGGGADLAVAAPAPVLTLAEQARSLQPGTYRPGPGIYRIGRPVAVRAARPDRRNPAVDAEGSARAATTIAAGPDSDQLAPAAPPVPASRIQPEEPTVAEPPLYNRRASDAALQNLEFIGSSPQPPSAGAGTPPAAAEPPPAGAAPPPNLRGPRYRVSAPASSGPGAAPDPVPGRSAIRDLPTGGTGDASQVASRPPSAAVEPARPALRVHSAIDMDSTHPAFPPPVLTTAGAGLAADFPLDAEDVEHGFGKSAPGKELPLHPRPLGNSIFNDRFFTEAEPTEGSFSNSLITSDNYDS